MAVTIAGIVCQEVVHDYSEQYDITGGPSANKTYLCNWADRFTVIHGILGLSTTTHTGGLITFNTPLPYPELAAESTNLLASMYARNVVCTGVGPPVQGASNIAFSSAKIQVTFGNFPWTFSGIDFFQIDPTRPYIWIQQEMDFSGEFTTIPSTQAFVKSSGDRLDAPFGFFVPLVDFTLTLKNIPYLPAQAALTAAAKPLNTVTYLGAPPGYCMFKGMRSSRTKATDGTQTAEIVVGFGVRTIAPWDCVYNGTKPSADAYAPAYWDQVVSNTGVPVIGRSDLSTIIPTSYVA